MFSRMSFFFFGHRMVSQMSRRRLISVALVDLIWDSSSTDGSTPVGKIKELDLASNTPFLGGYKVLPYKSVEEWSLDDRLIEPSVGEISGERPLGEAIYPGSMSEFCASSL